MIYVHDFDEEWVSLEKELKKDSEASTPDLSLRAAN